MKYKLQWDINRKGHWPFSRISLHRNINKEYKTISAKFFKKILKLIFNFDFQLQIILTFFSMRTWRCLTKTIDHCRRWCRGTSTTTTETTPRDSNQLKKKLVNGETTATLQMRCRIILRSQIGCGKKVKFN